MNDVIEHLYFHKDYDFLKTIWFCSLLLLLEDILILKQLFIDFYVEVLA